MCGGAGLYFWRRRCIKQLTLNDVSKRPAALASNGAEPRLAPPSPTNFRTSTAMANIFYFLVRPCLRPAPHEVLRDFQAPGGKDIDELRSDELEDMKQLEAYKLKEAFEAELDEDESAKRDTITGRLRPNKASRVSNQDFLCKLDGMLRSGTGAGLVRFLQAPVLASADRRGALHRRSSAWRRARTPQLCVVGRWDDRDRGAEVRCWQVQAEPDVALVC